MEKRELSCTVGENANRYSYYGEHYGYSLKKLGIKLPYGPAIPLLGIYSEKTTILKDTCTLMFIVALSTIARTCTQPRWPLTDEWIKKLWYIITMEYYSAMKRNAFDLVLMSWTNLEPTIQGEASQKNKYHMVNTYTWNLER